MHSVTGRVSMRWVLLALALMAPYPASAGQFSGPLLLDPNPADQSGKTKLVRENFAFDDANGLRWMAGKGDVTDGASIPRLFQPIVGGAFNESYIRAAVIHDHYCDPRHHVRSW